MQGRSLLDLDVTSAVSQQQGVGQVGGNSGTRPVTSFGEYCTHAHSGLHSSSTLVILHSAAATKHFMSSCCGEYEL